MPAIYSIDLIEKRDKKRRMDRSIIKGWNVHYQTLAEAEEEARLKKQKEQEDVPLQEPLGDENMQEDSPQTRPEEGRDMDHAAYNKKTGSFSGHYGKAPVEDDTVKSQIHAILNEKKDMFHSTLSALQQEHGTD